MSVWAIGDLQGCYDPTQRLLEKIGFDPARDRLWFCGDLVNRGGQSMETLRLVHSLRANSIVVLGNHDLSLLAISERREEEQRKVNHDLQGVLFAPDRDELLGWLRTQKLLHVDRELGWMMVHAGLAPKWTTTMAERHAREVEERLLGDEYPRLLKNMYGDKPAWHPKLDRHRPPSRDHQHLHPPALLHAARPHLVRGQGRARHAAAGPVSLVRSAGPRRARPEDRLRALVDAGPVHRPWRACDRHRRGVGRQAHARCSSIPMNCAVQVPGRDVPANPPRARPPYHRRIAKQRHRTQRRSSGRA